MRISVIVVFAALFIFVSSCEAGRRLPFPKVRPVVVPKPEYIVPPPKHPPNTPTFRGLHPGDLKPGPTLPSRNGGGSRGGGSGKDGGGNTPDKTLTEIFNDSAKSDLN